MTRIRASLADVFAPPKGGCTRDEWRGIVHLAIDYQNRDLSEWPGGLEGLDFLYETNERLLFARHLYRVGKLNEGERTRT